MDLATFNRLLTAATRGGASDIHLKTGAQPAVRIHGALTNVRSPAFATDDMERIASYIAAYSHYKGDLNELREWDTSYTIDGVARFRVSLYRQRGEFGAVLRIIPFQIPSFESLGVPAVVEKIAAEERGLILVTGVAGSGKSSTLAAIIDHINGKDRKHILTIEDPIEFLHPDKQSRITQREVGIDTGSFSAGLRAALRQDPDVILIGEMRDFETIDIALKAAETGHLVLATLHTTDTMRSISRIVGTFPSDSQYAVRLRLAEALKAIVSQRLLPATPNAGKKRVLACEVLVSTLALQDMIREPEKMTGFQDYLEKGTGVYGTQSFDQHLLALFREEKITRETMYAAATNPSNLERILNFEG